MKTSELRAFLIEHLDNAIVPYKRWRNRDTPSAQKSQAKMRMLLKAGCKFKIVEGYDDVEITGKALEKFLLNNTHRTIYISIFSYRFEDDGQWETSYSPHPLYLKECIKAKRDWY